VVYVIRVKLKELGLWLYYKLVMIKDIHEHLHHINIKIMNQA